MSTLLERRDYIAQCLLARGINKTSIIAILCNGYHESGGTLSPTQTQRGGGGGFGIWQWTGNARQSDIVSYARSHSEKDAIKWQCNFLADNRPNQWIANAGISWNDFLHNTGNWDWKKLTYVFEVSWERADIPNMQSRYNAYEIVGKNINWGNGAEGGDNQDGGEKDEINKKKFPTLKQCLSLFDKQNNSNNGNNTPDNPSPGGAVGGFNNKAPLEYFNKYRGHLYYSMPERGGVFAGRSADCSSFVSYMLKLGFGDNDNQLYTTENLHDRLTRLGYKCVQQGSNKHANNPFKTGDVIILGKRGSSSGGAGHTGICLDSPKFHDCNFTSNGLKEYASGQAFLDWNTAATYWYHYTK